MLIKEIQQKVLKDIYLFQLNLKISKEATFLIQCIEEGIKKESYFHYRTNVKGKMTDWHYFDYNVIFHRILTNGFNILKELRKIDFLHSLKLAESWGIKIEKGDYTVTHDHTQSYCSGILYLNDSDNLLEFPELDFILKPKLGTFLLFSPTLLHGTKQNKSDEPKYAIPFNMHIQR